MANLVELHCRVCGHRWVPRKSVTPRWCPNCNSTRWATGRVRPPIAEQRARAAQRRGGDPTAGANAGAVNQPAGASGQQARPNLRPLLPSRVKVYTLAGVTTAGPWSEITDGQPEMISSLDLLDWSDGDYLMRIDGEEGSCLCGDGIYPQDIVHLRPEIQYENGDIVHVSGVDSAGRTFATLKHIYHQPGCATVELRPSNGDTPIIVAPADQMTIHGVLIGFTHRGRVRRKHEG